ncbi:MAG: FAD-dependent oxidoreductase, partial [Patescibacteria group bacterium]
MKKYDLIIIGGACAGLTAGLYGARRGLKTLILTKDIGGQAGITFEIENYPGTGKVNGYELMMNFKKQAEDAGAEIQIAEVNEIESREGAFVVKSSVGEYEASSLILAFGLEHRKLGVIGEKEFLGKGVTYCATCDGPLYKRKTVAVVGGGNSAFDAAEYLSGLCKKVYLIHRSDKFRADQVLIDVVKNKSNIEVMVNTEIAEIVGKERVEKVIFKNGQELQLDGVFIEIGYSPKTDFIKDLVKLDEIGQVIIDKEGKTNVPGIFGAGDVTDTVFKQVVISAGEGAKASLSAARYLQSSKGLEIKPDWD